MYTSFKQGRNISYKIEMKKTDLYVCRGEYKEGIRQVISF